jgi:hypothetical protein
MKQEKTWDVVSASYDPLELYKLIESVVLKQTKDQYLVAAMWDQYRQVFNAQQGTLSNTEFYRLFLTKIEEQSRSVASLPMTRLLTTVLSSSIRRHTNLCKMMKSL